MNREPAKEPKLFFPGLAGFYSATSEIAYLLIRIAAGSMIFSAGVEKVIRGPIAVSGQGLARFGFQPPEVWGNFLMGFELIGGACIVFGLLTRFFAAGAAIEMAFITFGIQFPLGFARGEPYLVWGIALLAIALRGGGPYSIDRTIGKEL